MQSIIILNVRILLIKICFKELSGIYRRPNQVSTFNIISHTVFLYKNIEINYISYKRQRGYCLIYKLIGNNLD